MELINVLFGVLTYWAGVILDGLRKLSDWIRSTLSERSERNS